MRYRQRNGIRLINMASTTFKTIHCMKHGELSIPLTGYETIGLYAYLVFQLPARLRIALCFRQLIQKTKNLTINLLCANPILYYTLF